MRKGNLLAGTMIMAQPVLSYGIYPVILLIFHPLKIVGQSLKNYFEGQPLVP